MIDIKPNQEYDLLTAFPDREDAIDKLMEKYAIADIHYAIFNSEDIVPNTVCYPFKGKYITVFLNKDLDDVGLKKLTTDLKTVVGYDVERTSFPEISIVGKVVFRIKNEILGGHEREQI